MATITELRRRFARLPDCRLVAADFYVEQLTGHQPLVRSDEPSANLAGLLDESTGQRIFVPIEELARLRRPALTQVN